MPAGVDPQYAREIGQAIAATRRARGLTQEELRRQVGNSKNAVSNWERGASAPTVQNLREICRVLDVPAETLLGITSPSRHAARSAANAEIQRLADRIAIIRQATERSAPSLIDSLREAERYARHLSRRIR